MSAEEVAKAFVQHFYQTFDAGVDALSGLFVSIISLNTSIATDHSNMVHSLSTSIVYY